jgi:UDP-glucose 4-epimerase
MPAGGRSISGRLHLRSKLFSEVCQERNGPGAFSPLNSYGFSKRIVEQNLADYGRAYGLPSVIFRYFNAAGADPAGDLGEDHDLETHLIPLTLDAISGKRAYHQISGDDYPTPDGTCMP